MMNSVEELQRKQPAAKIQRLVEFEQITRLTSVKFSVPVTEDSSYWRLKAVPQAITQPSVMFI